MVLTDPGAAGTVATLARGIDARSGKTRRGLIRRTRARFQRNALGLVNRHNLSPSITSEGLGDVQYAQELGEIPKGVGASMKLSLGRTHRSHGLTAMRVDISQEALQQFLTKAAGIVCVRVKGGAAALAQKNIFRRHLVSPHYAAMVQRAIKRVNVFFTMVSIFLAFRRRRVYSAIMAEHKHKLLIDAIGSKAIKDAYTLSRQRLHAWKKRGIPHSHRVAVARLAAERGVAVPADFFEGMAA